LSDFTGHISFIDADRPAILENVSHLLIAGGPHQQYLAANLW
jgi:hypothetical protein